MALLIFFLDYVGGWTLKHSVKKIKAFKDYLLNPLTGSALCCLVDNVTISNFFFSLLF